LDSFWTYRRTAEVDGEIVARIERRRQWTPREKAALMAEVEAEGGQVSVVARRHGISKSLLYNWRSAWKAAALVRQASLSASPEFTQLGVIAEPVGDRELMRRPADAPTPRGTGLALAERIGVIEIDLPDGAGVRIDSGVNEKALRRVLSALRGSG
jgi:transposase